MTKYPKFTIVSLYVYYVVSAVCVASVHFQSCKHSQVGYLKLFSDKSIQSEESTRSFIKNGIQSPSNCLIECSRRLGHWCLGFVFNKEQQRCTGYKFSLLTMPHISQLGSVGYGNTNIHRLTSQKPHELMVDLERFNGEIRHAAYSSFSVASESKKFKLHVSGYSGNAGDSFVYHNGQFFSTGDQDNDPFQMVSCAEGTAGGWWFNTCLTCNLNGFWYSSETQLVRDMGITWSPDWINIYSSLKTSAMKIRPVNDTLLP